LIISTDSQQPPSCSERVNLGTGIVSVDILLTLNILTAAFVRVQYGKSIPDKVAPEKMFVDFVAVDGTAEDDYDLGDLSSNDG
jgi:hypothetical protein